MSHVSCERIKKNTVKRLLTSVFYSCELETLKGFISLKGSYIPWEGTSTFFPFIFSNRANNTLNKTEHTQRWLTETWTANVRKKTAEVFYWWVWVFIFSVFNPRSTAQQYVQRSHYFFFMVSACRSHSYNLIPCPVDLNSLLFAKYMHLFIIVPVIITVLLAQVIAHMNPYWEPEGLEISERLKINLGQVEISKWKVHRLWIFHHGNSFHRSQ